MHLDSNGLYVAVSQFSFTLPSDASELRNLPDTLMYLIKMKVDRSGKRRSGEWRLCLQRLALFLSSSYQHELLEIKVLTHSRRRQHVFCRLLLVSYFKKLELSFDILGSQGFNYLKEFTVLETLEVHKTR